MFPGQGSHSVGMGAESTHPEVAKLYAQANEILGYDLRAKSNTHEALSLTAVSQPAIFVSSMAAVALLRSTREGAEAIESAGVACGLSLGESHNGQPLVGPH